MALLQQIAVPLLAVNDTSLTVVEIGFGNKSPVTKGDTILVFETSKTTYDVIAEFDGFIKYKCELQKDYNVNDIVAEIYSDESEIITEKKKDFIDNGSMEVKPTSDSTTPSFNYEGEIIISNAAKQLITKAGISINLFSGYEMVSSFDVEKMLNPGASRKNEGEEIVVSKGIEKPGLPIPEKPNNHVRLFSVGHHQQHQRQ